MFIENLTTCGIEFECDVLNPNDLQSSSPGILRNWKCTHDASIETDVVQSARFTFLPEKNFKYLPVVKTTIGVELVSNILNSDNDDFYNVIDELTNFLSFSGETEQSERSGPQITFLKKNKL